MARLSNPSIALSRRPSPTIGAACVLAIVGALALPVPTQAQSSAPVMIGGEADLDACGANGAISGLDPNGDNFLSVRAGPSSRTEEIDRLHEGDNVFLCDQNGRWIGIVYGSGSCGVTTPVRDRKPYRGGCRSGWVFENYVRLTAG